jgi:nitrite reductase/ring-hydroxylating ferredoxin subunit
MKCLDIGQTGRILYVRYKEHIHATRNNCSCGYAYYILNTEYTYGTTTDIMDIINQERTAKNI